VLVLVGLAVVASAQLGCSASFRQGGLEKISEWPPAPDSRRAITIEIDGLDSVPPPVRHDWSEIIVKAFRESGQFSDVRLDGDTAEIHAKITVERIYERVRPASNFIIGQALTLHLIPRRFSQTDITMRTVYSPGDGEKFVVTRSEAVNDWDHLFLTVFLWFRTYWAVVDNVVYDMTRLSIMEAKAAGVFQ
jgi:hypothetical protein